MIIVLGGKKGGTGKSNIAFNLAGAYVAKGKNAVIIDADENATCVNKAGRRNEIHLNAEEQGNEELLKATRTIPVQSVSSGNDMRMDLREAKKHYGVIIVDCGGFETKAFKSAVMVADKIIIPTQLSQDDIEQLDPLFEWLRKQETDIQFNHEEYAMDIRVVFSRVQSYQSSEKKEAKAFLQEYMDLITISGVAIKEKSDVRKLSKAGMTYHDVSSPLRAQYDLLIQELEGEQAPLVPRQAA
ncbi:ParA family protein [Alteromonas macleodii]|uniref:CobQ/CobB/MinD/ParA nucleotide binding domain protein n=1 Tax=Alteromonas macleodii TaxID=28108 RepID=A0AB36FKW7_ALTMA|nr:ParA family protein [Alteromonas macleodii]OES24467.1 cobQ/CobB/MinD/ParA nucleotide binding domain protein [Alteromonas macleodii]OES25524.1 cobQ/CobB/MinD/ParA nucleotide binding domain protein [Alteromonas macleodii]OES25826.1 cobQ/CobB/MinD/ParA nucleotide binding domain protein [Alteromonas macleodii]OES38654.1 cobQ/CobB/MinD/ParA nucleotide binding domain protein [Alteromonas macleodii]